ncbi:phage virion morphogenesis protein [Comamonas sp. J-3]|uniref:phage virion morphogenesis protein n=1 Tax=Comamonas trifloxystrobinivorans TaxID=3350256 RepID=UPI003729520C
MAELKDLDDWAGHLLAKLGGTARRRLAVDIARKLRTANAQRMRAQTDPDGNAWEPRKPPGPALRSKRERIRQAAQQRQPMFAKLRMQRHIKARSEGGNAAVVEFVGGAKRIASVHHFGERGAVNPGGPMYDYPARELLGISADDADWLRDYLLDYLSR